MKLLLSTKILYYIISYIYLCIIFIEIWTALYSLKKKYNKNVQRMIITVLLILLQK